jgi:TetR/AcrR family transcriptional repressor of nem operon
MRYVKGHGRQTRSRIVEEASYGLRQTGVDGMSVADLMKRVGLTHGGFYSHFESREALVIEAFASAMDRTVSHWLKLVNELPAEERFDAFIGAYLRPLIAMIGHAVACCRPWVRILPAPARRHAASLRGSSTK